MSATTTAAALAKRLQWDEIDPDFLRRLVVMARDEDLAGLGLLRKPARTGDQSTASLATAPRSGRADLVARQEIVACGLPLLPLILSVYADDGRAGGGGGGEGRTSAQLRVRDGDRVARGGVMATLEGDPRVLLAAERVILNFLQRLSGVATQTRLYADALAGNADAGNAGTRTRLLDTRKTTPGYRVLEKYAVGCGGGWNHRLGLFDRVMLKDNHLALLGSDDDLAAAVARARTHAPELPVEVEVDRLDQIPPVLAAGADVILLDNFPPARIAEAVALIGGRAFTEASGGITLKNLPDYARLGVDFVSTGAPVHQSTWVDIGLDWRPADATDAAQGEGRA
ncbi:carboxylating nicotinate-nucleotide diphosphorylase [Opitutaceae bacterium TAV4]|nr:carboxylating nicotinate-nucleotide diphosphorylase [Opitutaceae bacterium TAV4]RRK00522.1 carboxylating nicotinate-nucleotide diphosphorylase [Opitutaceae bacterium TAV3]